MILGGTNADLGTATDLVPNQVVIRKITLPFQQHLSKLTARLDGLGDATDPQPVRGVIYTSSLSVVALADQVVIADAVAPGWFDLSFSDGLASVLNPGDYWIGLHSGDGGGRYYQEEATDGLKANDSYADGTEPNIPPTSAARRPVIFATLADPWTPVADDQLLAAYGRATSQSVLDASGPAPQSRASVSCGWHGTRTDPSLGYYALVRTGGKLADRVGERLRISEGARHVTVYVLREADILEDISITRLAFAQIGLLAVDELSVIVETLA